jgi:hypothetical protein
MSRLPQPGLSPGHAEEQNLRSRCDQIKGFQDGQDQGVSRSCQKKKGKGLLLVINLRASVGTDSTGTLYSVLPTSVGIDITFRRIPLYPEKRNFTKFRRILCKNSEFLCFGKGRMKKR